MQCKDSFQTSPSEKGIRLCNKVVPTDTMNQRLMISDVVANSDKLGVKTEALVNDILNADPSMKVLDKEKYRGNNGLDHVVEYVGQDTGKTMIMVIDSKQLGNLCKSPSLPHCMG